MLSAALPDNETERQHALFDLAILDTASEPAFDELARLAAHMLKVPIALVSLVDADREWFKARYGLDASELPRDISFCGHVVRNDAPVVVRDAHTDVRFADNPAVTGAPHVRFYAGMPLRTADGLVLGSLCAIDHVPREPTSEQLEMLELLARQVMRLLEKRRLRLALANENAIVLESRNRLASMFAVMAEGVVVQNAQGEIISCNAAAATILALTEDQMRGRTSLDPRWRTVREDGSPFPGVEHPAMVALRTGVRQSNVVMGVHKPDASLGWISINSLPSRYLGEAVDEVVTTFHDITQLKHASERMAQQDRLATTGTLVAGVGHEINNPLTFLLGNLDLAIAELNALAGPSPSARLRDLAEILAEARLGADRIRKIVRGLRALSREDVALQPVNLDAVVDTSLSMALHELRRKATVTTEVAGLPAVLGDESRLTQVLVNLLVNAAQAFETPAPDKNHVLIRGQVTGPGTLRLSVIDNGPGIPADLIGRVFDPFFTTKAVGQGTGLGLAVSRGIISAIGGELTLESQPGQGAAFHLDLRLADVEEADDAAPSADSTSSRGRILVIDDDASVLSTIRRVLIREHDVTALSDPREAQRILSSPSDFDVILCDLMMPHITGQELYIAIKDRRPELAQRFVFVTGGATTTAAKSFLELLPNDVIEKPFSITSLLSLARRYVLRRGERQAR
jgi:signal transduction histidine kinase/CheY-like chemotaxis protein